MAATEALVFDLAAQVAEIRREIAMRRRVYPRFVADERMSQAEATARIATMQAALATLEALQAERDPQGTLLR